MENINAVDLVIITLFAASAMIGVFRGLFREAITIFTWVIALVLGLAHGAKLGSLLVFINSAAVQKTVGVVTIFVMVVVFGIIARIIAFKSFGIGKPIGIDRFLGGIFGLLRAWVIVVIALTFISKTSAADQPEYQKSLAIPHFAWAVDMFNDKVPDKWKKNKDKDQVPADTVQPDLANPGVAVPQGTDLESLQKLNVSPPTVPDQNSGN